MRLECLITRGGSQSVENKKLKAGPGSTSGMSSQNMDPPSDPEVPGLWDFMDRKHVTGGGGPSPAWDPLP